MLTVEQIEAGKVTQADRDAFQCYMAERARRAFAGNTDPYAELMLETLAAHRIAALEEAAVAVEDYGRNVCFGVGTFTAAIRALKGPQPLTPPLLPPRAISSKSERKFDV